MQTGARRRATLPMVEHPSRSRDDVVAYWRISASSDAARAAGVQVMKVVLEVVPFRIEDHGDCYRRMLSSLCEALAARDLTVKFQVSSTRTTFALRTAPADGFRIAWHSVGEVPNVWRVKEAPVPGYYLFDRTGFSGWAEIGRYPDRFEPMIDNIDTEHARKFVRDLGQRLASQNISKYPQSSAPFVAPGPFVFFPLQLLDDTVVALQRFPTPDVLDRAASIARDRKKYLVVKRHPHCTNALVSSALARLGKENEYVVQSGASIHSLLQASDAVLVANSGVGFEALLHHKPVYTFGNSEYELVTEKLETLDAVASAFAPSHRRHFDRVDRYLAFFLEQNCFCGDDPDSILRHIDRAVGEADASLSTDPETDKEKLQARLMEAAVHMEGQRRQLIALEAKLLMSGHFGEQTRRLFMAALRRLARRIRPPAGNRRQGLKPPGAA